MQSVISCLLSLTTISVNLRPEALLNRFDSAKITLIKKILFLKETNDFAFFKKFRFWIEELSYFSRVLLIFYHGLELKNSIVTFKIDKVRKIDTTVSS